MSRTAGALNKNKQALLLLLQQKYPDYHPVLAMADIANDMENGVEMRAQMHKEVAQYVTPKLKAVEVQLEGQVDARLTWCDPHTIQSEAITGGTASET